MPLRRPLRAVGEIAPAHWQRYPRCYGVTNDVVDVQWTPPCETWLFTVAWGLSDAALVFSNPLLNGQPNPVLDVWLAGKPWERVE